MFDAASRQCVCREGEFVPEVGRCIKPRDRFWNADCDTCFGNPIYPLLGAKRQSIELGGFAGLALSATYDSIRKVPQSDPNELGYIRPAPTSFGMGWESSLHKSFLFGSTTTSSSTVLINAARGSGRWVTFQNANDGRGGFAPASAGISDRLITLRTAGGGWQYLDASARAMESYDGTGRLMSISPAGGGRLTMTYSDAATPANVAPQAGLLIRIGNQFGRALHFEYERPASATLAPRVKAMIDPAGLRTGFDFDAAGNLLQVNWPDGHARQLLYEHASFPWALTGYLDENLARAGTYTYDNTGRATGTERGAGADRYSVTWSQAPAWSVVETWDGSNDVIWRDHYLVMPMGTSVTLPNGATQQLQGSSLFGTVRATTETQQAGSGNGPAVKTAAVDANGNIIQRDEFNGARSCFSLDLARNNEITRVEGLGAGDACASALVAGALLPAGSRKTSTQWHPDWRLATRTAEPLKLTTSVYNGQPDPFAGGAIASCAPSSATLPDIKPIVVLCRRVEQATIDADGSKGFAAALQAGVANRVWQYSYNEFGQVLMAKDPLNNLTTYAYYADTTPEHTRGDLQSVTNALNQVTQYTRYNPQGQVLQMVDVNGVVADYGYDLRQRLTSVSVAGAASSYEYWPTGLLKRAVQPDGSFVAYEYDDAHRLTAVADAKGNRIEYTLDNAGNRTAEAVRDPAGNLARQLARVHDALGRVQQISGREQ